MRSTRIRGLATIYPAERKIGGIGRVTVTIATVGVCASLVSCGKPASICLCTTTTNRQFAFVANAGSNNVSAYSVDEQSGVLSAVPGSPFAAGTHPGSLTLANAVNVPFTSFPWLSVQFAYVVNSGSSSVSAYSIDTVTGTLASLPGSPFATGNGPTTLALWNSSLISAATGAYTIGSGANFAYVVNHDSNSLSAFSIDSVKGTLLPVTGSPFGAGSGPVSFATWGKFAYVVDNGSNDVMAYSLDTTTGALTPVPGSPFATGSGPVGLTIAAPFVYVANSVSDDVSAYLLNAGTGALTPIPGSPFPAGKRPVTVTVATAGGFGYAYVLNQGSNNISGFAIDAGKGALTAVAGSPFAVGVNPVQLSLHTDMTDTLYAVNAGDNNVSAFAVGSSGALAPLSGSPYATGARPAALLPFNSAANVTPDGHQYFALVPNGGSNDVSAYTLDAAGGQFKGAMVSVSGSPFAAGSNPDSAAAITTGVSVPGS